ncbi:MAG: hemolysin III family protein [Clostridia bacterium]|nr:hemolysin III family protein [Clostridia bacterium]MDQ7790955.1 hemolysin III family protein [Clostridia bacterium]
MLLKLKDPVSGLTHLAGALLSVVALVLLVCLAVRIGTAWHVVAFAIFGASLILLYTASSLYHLLPLSERGNRVLRRLDHIMIFLLIAGTYTPVCLIPLRGGWGWSLLVSVWTLALAGVVLKLFWLQAPRWFSTGIYLFMGWLIVVAFWPLIQTVPPGGVIWMAVGGLFYTVGAVIYGLKRPNLIPGVFGFHEIFHLFVIAGSFSHFWMMLRYVLYIN